MKPLLTFTGTLNGGNVEVLKDDGCNTNIVSQKVVKRNRQLFRIRKKKLVVQHSKYGSEETTCEVIVNGTLKIGDHKYTSNWTVSDCRYDVMLGMPWHVENNPGVNYRERTVKLDDEVLLANGCVTRRNGAQMKLSSLGVKQFRKMLRNPQPNKFEVFQLIGMNTVKTVK
ncbi:MAG: retropepsin-like aspartic protease [Bacteroidota bacterium]